MSDPTLTATRRTPLTSVCLWVHDSYGVPHLVHQVMVLLWLNVRYANRSRTPAGLYLSLATSHLVSYDSLLYRAWCQNTSGLLVVSLLGVNARRTASRTEVARVQPWRHSGTTCDMRPTLIYGAVRCVGKAAIAQGH